MLSIQQEQLVPRSKEEDDLLARNSKKIKNGIPQSDPSGLRETWPRVGEGARSYNVGGPSFVDKLKGTCREEEELNGAGRKEDLDLSDDTMSEGSQEEEEICKITEHPSRNFPSFNFSSKMKQRGVITLINIGHGFFVVKFSNKEDLSTALTGGPWMIYDHYLTVQPWEAKFKPDKATVDKAAVWKKQAPETRQETNAKNNAQEEDGPEKSRKEQNSATEQWKVVQKPQRQRKPKENTGEGQKNHKQGSRFEILAEVADGSGEANEQQQVNVPFAMVPVRKNTEQNRQRNNVGGKERGKGKNVVKEGGIMNGAGTEVVEGAQTMSVQQKRRRAEKRSREMSKCTGTEVLRITMGEDRVGNDLNMEEERMLNPDRVGPIQDTEAHDGMEHRQHDLGDGPIANNGMEGEMGNTIHYNPLENEEPWTDSKEDFDSSMVLETPIGSRGPGLYRNLKMSLSGHKPILIVLADTRCQEESNFTHLLRLSYNSVAVSPSDGRSGGLVALWNRNSISVLVESIDRQFIHLRCEISGMPSFFLTSVYALPHSDYRAILWRKLKTMADVIACLWVVWGDFNDIISEHERTGGVPGCHRRIRWFQQRVQECNLIDLGASGPRFTWKGPRLRGCARLFERLDRALANPELEVVSE
ncbi:hypothetical protein K1719_003994 [Acacia pycnantha]|nr:hypothetical protein K1719_003994 [Acacia pycnantha]